MTIFFGGAAAEQLPEGLYELLNTDGLGVHDIRPWSDSLSRVRGLWPVGGEPEDKLDLWADMEVALEALDDDDSGDLYGLLRSLMPYLPTFGQTERVVAWSFT